MMRIGLSGGIGSGKSTAGRRLGELGAVVIDADQVAREVVATGTPGLARVVERFGPGVARADGSLDRPALASIVFGDDAARADLEAITHPLVAERLAELVAEAEQAGTEVLVYDVPLLVEKGLGSAYHLVLITDATRTVRTERLIGRGLTESDARARMDHQATPDQRRAAADVLIDNNGTPEELQAQVDAVWRDRITPYARNLAAGRVAVHDDLPVAGEPDPGWEAAGRRLVDRIGEALGERAPEIEHVGSTSVPGMRAKDVIDIQVGVRRLRDADEPDFVAALTAAGFPRVEDYRMDHPVGDLTDPDLWVKRVHGSCDPGRVTHLHVRQIGGAGWDYALLFRDWLRANPAEATAYADEKTRLSGEHGTGAEYGEAKAAWFEQAWPRMQTWAQRTGWHD